MEDDKRTLKLLILIAGILTIGMTAYYLVWNYTELLPRVGSATEYATVYQVKYEGLTGYCYEVHNETKTIYRSMIKSQPYIFQDGRDVIVKLQDGRDVIVKLQDADEYFFYNLDTEKERVVTGKQYKELFPINFDLNFSYQTV